ncbi:MULTISPECIES: LpqB family beta-propeller domain-containing protein [unclassified Amycolatopsis]|uniref:LpqB family beta-propeller domain-containing protein n=1 Tax=unclassified Amycolatopsis TaxID=2618356 RepID=UPI002E11DE4C|nr:MULTISPECIES: LpqB family beta-propeller domain-containing protein [unclassified Amycolatopsis]WSJ73879.1 LpqB family beta-propeller domain-containing protein [Amycolatopsis sp. NBC_01307]WSK82465.1 LpqB family beta-propeller domain-containing protein [Amycolatopsis sp. NBC_01286]
MKRVLLAVLCLVLVAGCANVPLESQPVVVPGERQGQGQNAEAPEPQANIDALTLVRDFIGATLKPGQNNGAARAYLDDQGQATWRPSRSLTIIQDTFGTVYDTEPQPDPNTQVVNVRGFDVGTLDQNSAFVPDYSPALLHVKVRKQPTGQWRIVDPPADLYATESDFAENYTAVPVVFYSESANTFVPDRRYVVAKPQAGLPGRVMDMLVAGPSTSLAGAVKNLLGEPVEIDTNVKSLDDGTLVVPLTGLTGVSDDTRILIAAQIVLSLQYVTSARIRILADGAPLVPNHPDWRLSELPAYGAALSPSQDLLGLMTVGGRVRSLGDGAPIAGPAGNGGYDVVNAAQSTDGKRLAVVERAGGGVHLRIGDLGRELPQLSVAGNTLSRPTWRPGSSEVWTVVDQQSVARVVLTPNGQWTPLLVNAADLIQQGDISELRFSRDGARVAAVVNGQLWVASVVGSGGDSVSLREPRHLQPHDLHDVVDVDWLAQDTLVAVTTSVSQPVVRVTVDGQRMDAFNSSNLTPQVHGVTAAPGRPIVVADASGLWTASVLGEVWRPQSHSAKDADPFYPG